MKSTSTLRLTSGILALLAVTAMLVTSPTSAQQGKQDFTLHNKTGLAIQELYVSPASKDDWEEDILGVDVLPSGESTTATFSPKEKAAKWDIKLVDENGKDHIRYNFNLLEVSEITVTRKNDGSWWWTWK